MCLFPNWVNWAVPQRNMNTGCVPTTYEMLLRSVNAQNINFSTFQEDFDFGQENSFDRLAREILNRYPNVRLKVRHFGARLGADKLQFIENHQHQISPILVSITLTPNGYWHSMPVIGINQQNIYLLHHLEQNANAHIQFKNRPKFKLLITLGSWILSFKTFPL